MTKNEFADFIYRLGYRMSTAIMTPPATIWIISGPRGLRLFPVPMSADTIKRLSRVEAKVLKWMLDG